MGEGRLLAGRYRLDTVVGRGGMGTVWRARDLTLHREVAVKEVVLPPGLSEGERDVLYERTLREARASARLSHPAVVVVHDVVEEDGRPWIVMELVLAPSLQDVLDREGPLPHRRVADIGMQMLGALRHAHSKGILHRDVKPSNVLLCDSGRVVLTDFGIAQMEGDATLTQTGLVMGSPAYIPPERAQGARAVPASDLWSLGATLYAALEGRSPYERSDAMSSLQAALLEPVPPPRNGGPLRPVLDGLLARQPMHRMNAEQAEPLLARVAATTPARREADAGTTVADDVRTVLDGPSETVTDPADLLRRGSLRQEPAPPRHDPRPPRRHTPYVPRARTAADEPPTAPDSPAAETIEREPYRRVSTPSSPSSRPAGSMPSARSSNSAQAPDSAPSSRSSSQQGRRRNTVLVTVIVLLVVGAVLAAAFLIRRQVSGSDAGAGYKTFSRDGYRVSLPEDWHWAASVDGPPQIQSPDGNSFLLVDLSPWTMDAATPGAQARRQASLAPGSARLPGYRPASLNLNLTYQGVPAADWEFTFVRGSRFHVVDRFVQLKGHPYALYFRTPEARWADSQKIRGTVYATFRVN
ncbi:serine/threonine protein kinase [Actinomadura logoneensis]|uniref:non-specific serine/threonine protein kinase n=1 Tax=Actinomadura logoneensis TaxID=2293572 RepID=A0A372JIK4_9ACTN|nr:serine/threonine-protein kinase [Actinomadura logoneensis]RFU39841.1 serine/threonine protein kinase [Actinomadura logoneensis]